jgi:hypothetical protein
MKIISTPNIIGSVGKDIATPKSIFVRLMATGVRNVMISRMISSLYRYRYNKIKNTGKSNPQ